MVEKYELEDVNLTGIEKPKSRIMKISMPHWAYVAICTFVYAGIWSYIGILKILSLNSYVFDLGISSERGWQILHTNLGLHGYLSTLFNSGIVYPLSPLTGSGNFFAMIIFQAFSISMVGPAIYLLAKVKGLNSKESMLLAFSFFIYFPVYGIMWFDFHYQAFFMPLFMFAYLMYMRKNYVSSALLFFTAGIVRYPYSIFPMSFAFVELFLLLLKRQYEYDRRRMVSMSILFILMIIWTALGFLNFGLFSTIPYSEVSQYTVTVSQTWIRLYVILLFLAPLLFLPILRIRWIVLTLPAFYLFLSSSYTWFTYPHVLQGQYTAGIVPFLFIGLIDYLGPSVKRRNDRNGKKSKKRIFFKSNATHRSIFAFLAILLFFNIFFAPFSPLNNQFGDQFNFQQNTSYNPQQFSELGSMLKMIPSSEQYIVYQNNIPELFPRPLPPGGALLMGGYLGSFDNVSVDEAINNSWQVNAGRDKISLPLIFAIADASNFNFYLPGNSVYSIVHDMYKSGKYGILSEGYGLILLQRGYTGTVKNYSPENITISGDSFLNSSDLSHNVISISQGNATQIIGEYDGTPLYLFPGHFIVTVYLYSQHPVNTTNIASMMLGVYSGTQELLLRSGNVSVMDSSPIMYKLTFPFSINCIAGNISYSLYGSEKNSEMGVSKVIVTQTSPLQN